MGRVRISGGALIRAVVCLAVSAGVGVSFAGRGLAQHHEAGAAVPPSSAVVLCVLDGDSFQARFPDGSSGGVRLIAFQQAQREARREGDGLWRKGRPPEVSASRAGARLGEHVAMRFLCAQVRDEKRYVTVIPNVAGLRVLVSKESGLDLGDSASWPGKLLTFSGILEGSPQDIKMYVRFPAQIIR